MRRVSWCAPALCAVTLLVVGCDDSSVVGSPPDDVVDVTTDSVDVVSDLDAPDAADVVTADAVDVTAEQPATDAPAGDVATDGPPGRCRDSSDCVGNELGTLCDVASGRCVPCLATNRGICMAGEYCAAALRCETGCGADADCASMTGATRCNLDTHRCVACVTDAHCPMVANGSGRCAEARCGFTCAIGFADCDGNASNGCEVDTRTTAAHCNGCGMACPDAPNAAPACAAGRCGITCAAGFADCDGNAANGCEVDTRTSAAHCGACGNACSAGASATAACEAGTCRLSCLAGFADCDGLATNGCEAALNGTANCGRCGNACGSATPLCAGDDRGGFACSSGCAAGQTRCGASCVDTASSAENCGACGTACATRANARPVCSTSACGIACLAGFGDCDGAAANGCETTVSSDVRHCGACGNACPAGAHAASTCEGGRCGLRCDAGFEDCDGNPSNGCEVDLQGSTASCGRCGNACPTGPGGAATCDAGRCGLRCDAGRGDCDGNPANGCETDLQATTSSCGRCGNACAAGANAAPTCAMGVCGATCAAGFADCDGLAATGCEVSLRGTANCGACGNACGASAPLCSDAGGSLMCVSGCASGEQRCGGSCVSTASSVEHCGGCGNTCPSAANATRGCATGRCGYTCNDGFGDCDAMTATGCETDTRASLAHCGACGRACPTPAHATATCTAGACGFTCATGFANCDGNATNGCETDTTASAANCGACGAVCASGRCEAGRCVNNRTCADIHAATPTAASGNFTIDPDGTGGRSAYTAWCDMTTDGGGWTVIFLASTPNYNDLALDYTINDPELLRISTQTLLAYRSATQTVYPNWARLDLPSRWRVQSPFRYGAQDEAVTVVVAGGAPTGATLRYGYATYSQRCGDPWVVSGNWGRLCVDGTAGPFYSGHSTTYQDTCSDSNQVWNNNNCSDNYRFTIAVR